MNEERFIEKLREIQETLVDPGTRAWKKELEEGTWEPGTSYGSYMWDRGLSKIEFSEFLDYLCEFILSLKDETE